MAFFLGLTACQAAGHTIEQEFSIGVSLLHSSEKDYRLQIELTNVTDHSITMRRSKLPWGNANSVTIRAFAAGYIPQEIKQSYAIDDPVLEPNVTFLPGETRKGEVDRLVSRLPALLQILSKTDVILFWLYQVYPPRGDNQRKPQYYGGMIVIRGK